MLWTSSDQKGSNKWSYASRGQKGSNKMEIKEINGL
jgi:hypothetical protein